MQTESLTPFKLKLQASLIKKRISVLQINLGKRCNLAFNQMMNLPAKTANGEPVTVAKLLETGSLDLINQVQTAAYCYGCTAGCGSSCSGALL